MRYELSDYEWTAIKPMLPNKPRGVRRVGKNGKSYGPNYGVSPIKLPWAQKALDVQRGHRHSADPVFWSSFDTVALGTFASDRGSS